MKKFQFSRLVPILLLTVLASCGGGGGGDGSQATQPPTATAEGVYAGTLAGSLFSNFRLLILENGEFWSLYGDDSGSIFSVYGFLQGQGSSGNGRFTASNVKDFYDPLSPMNGSVSGTYDSNAGTISGTVSSSNGNVQFTGGVIPNSTYDYERAASLSDVAGPWSTVSSVGDSVAINVAANGALTTSDNGCNGSGSVTPRPSGKNVFNVSLTFGGSPCVLPGQTVTGIAIVYPLDTGQTQLIAGAVNASRTAGITVFGIR